MRHLNVRFREFTRLKSSRAAAMRAAAGAPASSTMPSDLVNLAGDLADSFSP